MTNTVAQHFLSPPIGKLSLAKLSPDCRGDFLFTRPIRGDVGVDGRLFWKVQKSYRTGQRWMYPSKFYAEKNLLRRRKKSKRCRFPSADRRSLHPMAHRVATRLLQCTQSAVARQTVGMELVSKTFGCSRDELCNHLESLFEDGMSWTNFKDWHIDHIKPLSSFNMLDEAEIYEANHFSNLQPLWALDNLKKSNKYAGK